MALGIGRELFEPVRSSKGDVSDMMAGLCGRGGESCVGSSEEKRGGCRQGGWRVSIRVHALGGRSSMLYSFVRMVQLTTSRVGTACRRANAVLEV